MCDEGGLGKESTLGAQAQAALEVSQLEEEVTCLPNPVSPMHCPPTLWWKTLGLDGSLCPHPSRPCCPLTSSPLTDPTLQRAVLVSSGLPSLRPPVHFTDSNDMHGILGRGGVVKGLVLGTLRDHL